MCSITYTIELVHLVVSVKMITSKVSLERVSVRHNNYQAKF